MRHLKWIWHILSSIPFCFFPVFNFRYSNLKLENEWYIMFGYWLSGQLYVVFINDLVLVSRLCYPIWFDIKLIKANAGLSDTDATPYKFNQMTKIHKTPARRCSNVLKPQEHFL